MMRHKIFTEKHKRNISHGVKNHLPSTAFKKGQRPSIVTEFKKGTIPWNYGLTKKLDSRLNGPPKGHGGYNKGNPLWFLCKICDKKFRTYNCKLKINKGKYCSRKCAAYSLTLNGVPNRRGEKAWNWKGGIGRNKHGNIKDKKWRKQIFKRDNYTCRECYGQGGTLNAHHIKSWKKYPEKRYDLDNGITLCFECHKKTDTYAGKGMKKCRLVEQLQNKTKKLIDV